MHSGHNRPSAAAAESTSHCLKPKTIVAVSSPLPGCIINVINTAVCNFTPLFWFIEMFVMPTITPSYYYPHPSHILEGKSEFTTWGKKCLTPASFLRSIKYRGKGLCLKVFFTFVHPNS